VLLFYKIISLAYSRLNLTNSTVIKALLVLGWVTFGSLCVDYSTDFLVVTVQSDPMKQLYIVFFLICALGYGQSSSENYVHTRTYQAPRELPAGSSSSEEVREEVVYYDGLGRPKQKVNVSAGGSLEDVITPVQ